jgi:transmembrane sensor
VSRLRFPLKDVLRDPADEAALHRVWQSVDTRLAPARPPAWRRALLSTLALGGAAAVLVVFVWSGRRDAGPLRLADGASVAVVETASAESRMSLSDGSEIVLAPGSRLEPLETSGSVFNAVLSRGRATFDVRPGGPRRWTIECGLATVEVVGTRFACARAPGRLRVNVERGAVLVRGDLVPDRARRLVMGEAIEIAAAALPPAASPGAGAGPVTTAESPGSREAVPAERPAPADEPRPVARPAGQTRSPRAPALSPGEEAPPPTIGAGDLLAIADRARIAGHPADAVAPLERILAEMPGDPQAPLAAFALGRLELDSLNRPRRAVAAFERALALGLPASLEEEARARLVEAYDRIGDPFAAADAARDLLSAFPRGRHARAMRARLAGP